MKVANMSAQHAHVRPNTYLFLRLPTETLRLIEIKLNTIIEVGKLGSFPSNLLLGRPYYHTYELLERREGELYSRLRIVPQSELNAEAGIEHATPSESTGEPATPEGALPEGYNLAAEDATLKTNQMTIDDASRQTLSHAEIEELKRSAAGKEVIEKILASHVGLDEKTVYSKAKYLLRKRQKYLKRFTVLPMDMGNLIEFMMEKDAPRIMEMREESLGLVTAWSNVHLSGADPLGLVGKERDTPCGRWLAVDDTGGLLVAAIAERMGILHPPLPSTTQSVPLPEAEAGAATEDSHDPPQANGTAKPKPPSHRDFPTPASSNSITLLHAAVQPNASILKYFGYDTSNPTVVGEDQEHPLHTHLKPLSWLQLLHPEEDPLYVEPERVSDETLATWKSGKRGTYFKKRRRWERCKAIVDETRSGGFDGLVIATHMHHTAILENLVPLIRGGGHVVIYSPAIEPLVNTIDLFSKDRRTAYINHISKGETPGKEDFPMDPRLLLAASIQTSRIRNWQVLPGRTHPLMTGRGGAEGYIFTARRSIPLEGNVEAKGNFSSKKRKLAAIQDGVAENAAKLGVSAEPVKALIDVAEDAQ
ncbi:hypothetical protein AC578_1598 [Pseudocercospora eumusae]|uniref:tRNA (adenine(58)-N(1))-methyltransferase non-catalytic subunit TRM6 n=1 Tax=Pseudocercospora eumusae TaxID=321146 RepID=A0A139HLY8_9PEZI|nr:hypothetical protein AC578_1598 [Pseudocercospora eumusae]